MFPFRFTGGDFGPGVTIAAAVAEQLARSLRACASNCSVGCDTPHNSYNHQPPRGGEVFVGHSK